jgi:hypothetical protein
MKSKLFICGKVSEQLVATFRTEAEAFACGSLLQSCTEDENLLYYVEYKGNRTMVDSFIRRLPFLNKATQQNIKNYFNEPA